MDGKSFAEAVGRCEKKLYIAALSVVRNAEDAKDAVAEAVYKAWKHRDKLRDESKFDAWLLKITLHESYKLYSSRRVYTELDELYDCFDEQTDPGDVVFFDTLARSGLDEKTRRILLLRFFYGMTLESIAKETGMKLPSVKTRYYRALEKLRKLEGKD